MQAMTQPHALPGLSAVAADYDILLCDVWGVIHNGRESWPEACNALTRFNEEGGHVVLISNSPRPALDVIAQLDGLGVPRSSWKAFVTSGDATRAELARRAPGPALIIGPARDVVPATGSAAPNPDAVPGGEPVVVVGLGRFGGALADVYESLGGRVTMAGKPYGPIYALSLIEAERLMGKAVDRSRVLCIGDGVITDVLGANQQALDCLFIAQGIHGDAARGEDGLIDPARAAALLTPETAYARYAALDLKW